LGPIAYTNAVFKTYIRTPCEVG